MTARRARGAPAEPSPGAADLAAIQEHLLWARGQGFAVHQVTVGSAAVVVQDLRPVPAKGRGGRTGAAAPAEEPPRDMYELVGGDAWRKARAAVPDPDEEPEDGGDHDADEPAEDDAEA